MDNNNNLQASPEADDDLTIIDVSEETDGDAISESPSLAKDTADNSPNKKRPRKKKTKGDIIRLVIMAIAVCVFIFSAIKLAGIFINYSKGDKEYKKVEKEVFDNTAEEPSVLVDSTNLDSVTSKNGEYEFLPYDHAALKAISSDAQGYLDFPSIGITVPIAQCSNNDYYINHAITGTYHSYGCPFIDYRIKEGLKAKNPIIYGHSMKNGAMFGMLTKYLKPAFYNEKGNEYFYVYCEEGIYIYEIFSIYITNAYDDSTYVYSYDNPTDYENYVINAKNRSYFNTGVDVSAEDDIITLSTCYDDKEARLIMHAKKLK